MGPGIDPHVIPAWNPERESQKPPQPLLRLGIARERQEPRADGGEGGAVELREKPILVLLHEREEVLPFLGPEDSRGLAAEPDVVGKHEGFGSGGAQSIQGRKRLGDPVAWTVADEEQRPRPVHPRIVRRGEAHAVGGFVFDPDRRAFENGAQEQNLGGIGGSDVTTLSSRLPPSAKGRPPHDVPMIASSKQTIPATMRTMMGRRLPHGDGRD